MAKLGSAIVFINGELGGLQKSLAQAERMAKASVGNINKVLNNIGKVGFATGGAIYTGLAGLGKIAIDVGGSLDDLSKKTGLSVEAISELSLGLKLSGTDAQSLAPAMKSLSSGIDELGKEAAGTGEAQKKLNEQLDVARQKHVDLNENYAIAVQRLHEVQASGKASASSMMSQKKAVSDLKSEIVENNQEIVKLAEQQVIGAEATGTMTTAFGRLGLKLSDFKGLNPDESFLIVARAIEKVPDPMQRAALATDIFSKAGQNLLPVLSNGEGGIDDYMKKARALGQTVTTEGVEKLDALGDTVDTVKSQLINLATDLVTVSATAWTIQAESISGAIAQLDEWIAKNPEAVKTGTETAVNIASWSIGIGVTTTALSTLIGVIGSIATIASVVGVGLGALTGAFTILATGIVACGETVVRLALGMNDCSNFLSRLSDGISNAIPGLRTIRELFYDIALAILKLPLKAIDYLFGDGGPVLSDRAQSIYDAMGSDSDANSIGANAAGTDFWKGGMTWVGERGPELINAPRGSQIYSNTESKKMAAGGGGITITGPVTIQATADQSPAMIWRQIKRAEEYGRGLAGA